MKFIIGALTAVTLLVGVSATQQASAAERCFWNGFGWQCRYTHHHWWRHHHPVVIERGYGWRY